LATTRALRVCLTFLPFVLTLKWYKKKKLLLKKSDAPLNATTERNSLTLLGDFPMNILQSASIFVSVYEYNHPLRGYKMQRPQGIPSKK